MTAGDSEFPSLANHSIRNSSSLYFVCGLNFFPGCCIFRHTSIDDVLIDIIIVFLASDSVDTRFLIELIVELVN